jgi:sigma-B regulation protein RsbU (phosphoserine phosphatase)
MFPVVDYGVKELWLEKGDTALFFTDGITECRNKADKEYSEEKLIEVLKGNRKLPSEKLCDRIFDEVSAYCEEVEQMDDMTVVVVKRVS